MVREEFGTPEQKDGEFVWDDLAEPAVEPAENETEPAEEEELSEEEKQARAEAADRLKKVVERVRADSRDVKLTDPAVFLAEPFSFDEEQMSQVWADMEGKKEYEDIVRTKDEHSGKEYLHSSMLLTTSYATMMLRTEANDPPFLIAETVRDQSRIYPQPVSVEFFQFEPFKMSAEEVIQAVEVLKTDADYSDICYVETTNGVTYLYSDRYMNERAAYQKAQWAEVDWVNNQ